MVFIRSASGVPAAVLGLLVLGPSFSPVALAAPELEQSPSPEALEPESSPPPAEAPAEEADLAVPEPELQRPDGLAEGDAEDPAAEPPVAAPLAGDATVAEPPSETTIDPSLLDAEPSDPLAPVSTTAAAPASAPAQRSPEERDAAIEEAYANLYRPADNPVRLNVTGRLVFANISGRERVNGRMGGASVDIGPSWNRVGVAATFTGWGGRLQLPRDTGTEMNAMLGGGLTVGMGRLALQSRGFIDLRLGYDVFYGVVNQRSAGPPVVAPQADSQIVTATAAENLLPHGPRARLDLGLLGAGNRRFFHGIGLHLGYQALLGSLKGDLPASSMLTLGFSYWMG
ncbi:MAG: hypothetical protein H6712_01795 [Myxococcales bacterium]|nr:hypothetical protein [Myxococcales bacterium]MCB9712559.1 hypothetical protein [Myxococcales bacterium]